jgi:hypothetical protein
MSKKLLILTGPQGSGNHMWSKIFSEDTTVQGWKQLTQQYWVGHGDEPFAEVWDDPSLFSKLDWPHQYYFTSTSCPFLHQGGPVMTADQPVSIPKYEEFISAAQEAGFEVIIAVIGRDKNILGFQQKRVRTQLTYPIFLEQYDSVLDKYDPIFISTELVYLYEHRYLNQLSKILNWPINLSKEKLATILEDNANEKYLRPVDDFWLDKHMAATSNGVLTNPYRYTVNNKDI